MEKKEGEFKKQSESGEENSAQKLDKKKPPLSGGGEESHKNRRVMGTNQTKSKFAATKAVASETPLNCMMLVTVKAPEAKAVLSPGSEAV